MREINEYFNRKVFFEVKCRRARNITEKTESYLVTYFYDIFKYIETMPCFSQKYINLKNLNFIFSKLRRKKFHKRRIDIRNLEPVCGIKSQTQFSKLILTSILSEHHLYDFCT